jgi:glutamate-1-semialdehyde 2,1-aminomutase
MKRTGSSAKSQAAFQRAQRVIPGGVNSPARAFGAVGGVPPVMRRGRGCRIVDIDGNERIDYVGSWGPLILGHAHPAVVKAVTEALECGTSFGAPTEAESELAELIVDAVPSIEQVRLVNSGTEAAASAIRLARGCTGRDLVLKFAGCYHGHVDSLLVQAGSAATTLGVPSSPGVPAGCTRDTLLCRFNDLGQVADLLKEHYGRIACVIVEPAPGNMGVVPPAPGFLEGLRELTAEQEIVLIFDEVMSGFRVAFGGAQSRFGIQPDMTILGKIVGGGLPVGAYGGRRDIMQSVSPVGPCSRPARSRATRLPWRPDWPCSGSFRMKPSMCGWRNPRPDWRPG